MSSVAVAICFTFLSQTSHGETRCEKWSKNLSGVTCNSPEVVDLLPRACHRQRIEASGILTFNILRRANTLGLRAWQREVITKYGERFQQWEHAACQKIECVSGAVAGSCRCTFAAFPCSPDVDAREVADLEKDQVSLQRPPFDDGNLAPSEIREMQQMLLDAGYPVFVDGIFGNQTRSALADWQRSRGLSNNGAATRANLESLRRMSRMSR
jgi:hypothetical protein